MPKVQKQETDKNMKKSVKLEKDESLTNKKLEKPKTNKTEKILKKQSNKPEKEAKPKKSKIRIPKGKIYSLDEGLRLILEAARAQFDESIDVSMALGVDPKQSDQQVRGALALPNGLGKNVKVLVFAKGDKEEEAKKAGADVVGGGDIVEKIKGGWMDFDRVIATPDMMSTVTKAAKILGPKGLMPSPKSGSVTVKIFESVQAEKKGKASFRVDKSGIIHSCIGKKSMGFDKLKENYLAFAGEIIKNKPSKSKGIYLKKVFLSSTMGQSVSVNTQETSTEAV